MPETPDPKSREPLPPPTCVTPCALGYAELDVTSNFSFLRGASHPDELVYTAAELGYRAIAITDLHTLAGVVRAHAAAKSCKMKLLIGSRIPLIDGPELLVWATDRASYGRLCRMLTLGKRRVEKGKCELSVDDFIAHSEGLIAAASCPPPLVGGVGGGVGFKNQPAPLRLTAYEYLPLPRPLPQGEGRKALHLLRDALGDR